MAVMELKLDSLKFANVYGFERDFGKKKNSLTNGGSLTSKEFNEANALPFDLMRPTTILETTNILSVEYDAKLNISAPAEITLTIGNGSYIGQTCTVVNSSAVAHKIGINGDTVSISPKNRIVFEWYGETWESEDLRTVGTIKAYGGSTAPLGYLLCDGSEVSRSTYSTLFDVIGTTYGAGDGSTTFNLPKYVEVNEDSEEEETWTGEYWTDEKPLYRNVINITNTYIQDGYSQEFTLSNNFEVIIKTLLLGYRDTGKTLKLNSCASTIINSNTQISVANSGFSGYFEKLMLEYTKTTDTAGVKWLPCAKGEKRIIRY